VAHIAAQLAAPIIAHQHVNDARLGLGLHRQLAVLVLQQLPISAASTSASASSLRHGRRVIMRALHQIEHRPDPRHPPARIARGGEVQRLIPPAIRWPNAQRSTDFCAWMRFSASSHTAEAEVDDRIGHLLAAMRGQAVQEHARAPRAITASFT
jgi:hypothetical protein